MGENNRGGLRGREFEFPLATPFGHFVDVGLQDYFCINRAIDCGEKVDVVCVKLEVDVLGGGVGKS